MASSSAFTLTLTLTLTLTQVLLGFSLLLGNSPSIDLMGIVVGHVYYYCEDVFPYTPAGRGRQLLVTPRLLKLLVGQTDRQVDDTRVGQIDLTQMQQPQAPLPQIRSGSVASCRSPRNRKSQKFLA